MWRRSLSLRSALQKKNLTAPIAARPRWLSTAPALSPEEQELLNEPREGMDYDVLLVRPCRSLCACVYVRVVTRMYGYDD